MSKEVRPRLSEEEYELFKDFKERHKALAEECEKTGIDLKDVGNYWYKGEHFSIHATGLKQEEIDILPIIKEIVESRISVPLIDIKYGEPACEKAIKATLSDMHVGLEPNPDGTSLFEYEYNESVFNENLEKVFQSVVKEYLIHGRFDLLVLDDLGDGLDGFNGFTTRGGHKLDQNMTNVSAFKSYVNGKLGLIEKFIQAGIADKYSIRNVSNCNHAGSFGHIANSTIQMILERTYSKAQVDFYILEKFMEHFKYGNNSTDK
jgi:uncharacterized protein with GYD domain